MKKKKKIRLLERRIVKLEEKIQELKNSKKILWGELGVVIEKPGTTEALMAESRYRLAKNIHKAIWYGSYERSDRVPCFNYKPPVDLNYIVCLNNWSRPPYKRVEKWVNISKAKVYRPNFKNDNITKDYYYWFQSHLHGVKKVHCSPIGYIIH